MIRVYSINYLLFACYNYLLMSRNQTLSRAERLFSPLKSKRKRVLYNI